MPGMMSVLMRGLLSGFLGSGFILGSSSTLGRSLPKDGVEESVEGVVLRTGGGGVKTDMNSVADDTDAARGCEEVAQHALDRSGVQPGPAVGQPAWPGDVDFRGAALLLLESSEGGGCGEERLAQRLSERACGAQVDVRNEPEFHGDPRVVGRGGVHFELHRADGLSAPTPSTRRCRSWCGGLLPGRTRGSSEPSSWGRTPT